ncbi:MAG: hypothetical protein ACYTEU_12410 [Planctomycetota bacterium]
MKRLFSKTFFRVFPVCYIYILIPYLAIIYSLQKVYPFPEVYDAMKYPNTICFSFLLGLYGFTRILRFNPFSKGYFMQLALSPWQVGKPLPNGPIHLCWIDLIVLILFALLIYLFPVLHWTFPLIAFFAGYNFGLFSILCFGKQGNYIFFYTILLPLVAYPHCNFSIGLAVLICLTFLSQWKMLSYMKRFPWNTPWWTENPIEKFKQQALRSRSVGWPFKELFYANTNKSTLLQNIAVITVICWWIHVLSRLFIRFDPEVTSETIASWYILPIIFIPLIRLLVYLAVYSPPLSLLGRFRTGMLVIPGYDKLFIAPIILVLVGIFLPGFLIKLGIIELIAYELNLGLLLFLAIQLPPSHENWRYTGLHHIRKSRCRVQRKL